MSQITSHTELVTGIRLDEGGIPRISKASNRWQYALAGHSLQFPRTLTITRLGADSSTAKKGLKFVVSVLESDANGVPLPAPSVAVLELRALPEVSDTTREALVEVLENLSNSMIFSHAGHTYENNFLTSGVMNKGYELPEGNYMPHSTPPV